MSETRLRTRSFVAEITLHRVWYVERLVRWCGFPLWVGMDDTRSPTEEEAIERAKQILAPEPSPNYFVY